MFHFILQVVLFLLMIVDSLTKVNLDVAQVQRTSTSLKRIYNQLRQTYYQELYYHNEDKLQGREPPKKLKDQKERKKINKILPNLPTKKQLLTTKEIQKYLTHKQFPIKMEEDPESDLINTATKFSNRQLKEIAFPNRLNNLKLSRYLSRRRSQEPYIRNPEDIIISKKVEIFPTHRVASRGSIAQSCSAVKKKSILSPIKQLIRKAKAKISQLQLPIFISFQDFSTLMRQYHFIESKEQCIQYKAYIGKGNNSALVKRLLKDKGYWTIVDKYTDDVHFFWTQTKNNNLLKAQRKRQLEVYTPSDLKETIATPNSSKQIKHQSASIAKCITNDMLKAIMRSYTNAKKIGMTSLITQIKGRRKNIQLEKIQPTKTLFLNHVDHASCIGNKKGLLYHMTQYYTSIGKNPFDIVPESIHLVQRPSLAELKNVITFGVPCILKPASGTNRGNGITIHTTWASLHSTIQESSASKSFVVQRYLSPFLYKNRKFDIRVWVLWFNGQAWWYNEGYLRTSSKQYNLKTCNRFVHLTNDAVQKKSEDYGKYQSGNKLSFADFSKYLNQNRPELNFSDAISQMKSIAKDIFRVSSPLMDTNHKAFGYQLFGLDFMIDQNFKVWLIEANTNPCLETSCSLLNRLITNMLQGVLNLTVDIVFQPPQRKRFKDWSVQNFRFQLLYDQNELWNDPQQVKAAKFETDQEQFEDEQQQQ